MNKLKIVEWVFAGLSIIVTAAKAIIKLIGGIGKGKPKPQETAA